MASKLTALARHLRHTVAKWSVASSISRRISLLVALIVIGVLTSVGVPADSIIPAGRRSRSGERRATRGAVGGRRPRRSRGRDRSARRAGHAPRPAGRGAVDRCHRGDRSRRHGAASGRGQHVHRGAGRSRQPGRRSYPDESRGESSKQRSVYVRLAGAQARATRGGRERRSGEPASGAQIWSDARPGVCHSCHLPGDGLDPLHRPPAPGTAAQRDLAHHGPDGPRRSRRQGRNQREE